jgi:hypothetical protein
MGAQDVLVDNRSISNKFITYDDHDHSINNARVYDEQR